jgi:hypothetical protein
VSLTGFGSHPNGKRLLWVTTDKTRSEQNESGYPPVADIRADIAFRRSGPIPDISGGIFRSPNQRASAGGGTSRPGILAVWTQSEVLCRRARGDSTNDFATSRAHSLKRSTTGLSAIFQCQDRNRPRSNRNADSQLLQRVSARCHDATTSGGR